MDKLYFAKYLPVKGEIKGNGALWIAKENLGKLPPMKLHLGISFTEKEAHERDLTKVGLFLCSRDIRVGDKCRFQHPTNPHPDFIEDEHQVLDLHHSDYKPYEVRTNNGYGPKEGYFKVIGEISPEAVWVKEGDEFEGREIKREIGFFETKRIKIKCPTCKIFH